MLPKKRPRLVLLAAKNRRRLGAINGRTPGMGKLKSIGVEKQKNRLVILKRDPCRGLDDE